MADALSLSILETIFQESMDIIKKGKEEYQVNCSDEIIFGGYTKDFINPVKLVFNKHRNVYMLFFSEQYLNNPPDKVTKLFVRYIITTNLDGTFKTRKETKKELKKFTDSHFEVSYMNNFLVCDKAISDTVFCRKCKRTYKYPVDSEVFKNIEDYRCECGGELTKLVNTGEFDKHKANVYFNNRFKDSATKELDDVSKYPDSLFESIPHTEEDYSRFMNFVKNQKRISRIKLMHEVQEVINNESFTMLKMYDLAFPKVYHTVCNYIKADYKNIIMDKCPPSFVSGKPKRKKAVMVEELKQEDFNCSEEDFAPIKAFNDGKHSMKFIKNYMIEAIENDKVDVLKGLRKIDDKNFQKAIRYLKKSQKAYLTSKEMVAENNADVNETNE